MLASSSNCYFYRWLMIALSIQLSWKHGAIHARRLRSVDDLENNPLTNSVEFIWSTTTVAVGDTAVLHCSFDAIFQQLRTGSIDWYREVGGLSPPINGHTSSISIGAGGTTVTKRSVHGEASTVEGGAVPIATGKRVVTEDGRYRVYRPHNSALSVLIIRRAKKRDAGIYRCNLAGSTTRHKYMVLNVTESKIEAQTSAATQRAKIGNDVTLWCNATGYPKPVVYWTREDRNRQLPDGSHQYWGNGLQLRGVSEADTGIYACYLDNFVQPIVSYKFSLMVEDNPWNLDGYKMRFDSKQWYPQDSGEPKPVKAKSFLLMCETRQASKPLPIIRWYRDGNAVRNSRHFYIIEDSSDSRSSYASSTLVIMTFLPRFQGNYTCVASNVFRMKKLTFYIQGPVYTIEQLVADMAAAHTTTTMMPTRAPPTDESRIKIPQTQLQQHRNYSDQLPVSSLVTSRPVITKIKKTTQLSNGVLPVEQEEVKYLQTDDVDDSTSTGNTAIHVTSSGLPHHINIPRPGQSAIAKISLPVQSRLPFHSTEVATGTTTNSTRSIVIESQTPRVRQTVHHKEAVLPPGEQENIVVQSKDAEGKPGSSFVSSSTDDEDMTAGSGHDKEDEDYDDK